MRNFTLDGCGCGHSAHKIIRVGWRGESSYDDLRNKPKFNGVEIGGDNSGSHYGLVDSAALKKAVPDPADVKLAPAEIKEYITKVYEAVQNM